jgi:hypothetical protein
MAFEGAALKSYTRAVIELFLLLCGVTAWAGLVGSLLSL